MSGEQSRFLVLLATVVEELMRLSGFDRKDPSWDPILRELDHWVMRFAHASRASALDPDSSRARAARALIEDFKKQLAEGADPAQLEATVHRWSQSQADGPLYPGAKPEEPVHVRADLSSAAFFTE